MIKVKLFFAGAATFAANYLGGYDRALYALVVFLVMDYITGVAVAIIKKRLSSYVGLQGIIKKLLILGLVGLAATLDGITGMAEPWIRTATIYFLLANEGISILENMAAAGVPVPDFLRRVLVQLQDKNGVKEGDIPK